MKGCRSLTAQLRIENKSSSENGPKHRDQLVKICIPSLRTTKIRMMKIPDSENTVRLNNQPYGEMSVR